MSQHRDEHARARNRLTMAAITGLVSGIVRAVVEALIHHLISTNW